LDTLFTKIINREIPAKIIYEDDQVLAFHDIAPQAPVHFLVIPKKPIRTLNDLTESDKTLAGHILFTAQRLALEQGCEKGFRVVMNCNEDRWTDRLPYPHACAGSAPDELAAGLIRLTHGSPASRMRPHALDSTQTLRPLLR